jgi:hypothetical protein
MLTEWPPSSHPKPAGSPSCCAAAREAAILELLAPTPVSAPALVAADPDAAACDVPALLLDRLPGGPPDP